MLYVAAWNNSGEASQKATLPPFAKIVKQADKDGDGEISRSEMPWGPKVRNSSGTGGPQTGFRYAGQVFIRIAGCR